jgi:high-affinity Fe2+/Pb2+ permease
VLSHDDGVGQFLRAIFGYSSKPEVITLVVHVVYVVTVLVLYLRPVRPTSASPRTTPAGATQG